MADYQFPSQKYNAVATCLNTQITQRWARASVFMTLHSALLIAIIGTAKTYEALTSLSALGLFLCVYWHFVNERTNQMIAYWEKQLHKLERADPDSSKINVFSGRGWKQVNLSRRGVQIRFIVKVAIFVCSVVWTYVLGDSLFRLYRGW